MVEIPLLKFVETHGQARTAEMLGVTQSAVSQMIKSKRQIIVQQHDGSVSAYERKPIGIASTKRKAAA